MTATDYADRNNHSVTVRVKALGIPAGQNWNDDPTPGEQLLGSFLQLARQRQLITEVNPGTGISRDGTTFNFIINEALYAGHQEDEVSAAYLDATGRQLRFEPPPDYDDLAEAAVDGIDWGGMIGGVARFFGRMLGD